MKRLWNVIILIFEDRKSFAGACIPTVLPDPPTVYRKVGSLKKFLHFVKPNFDYIPYKDTPLIIFFTQLKSSKHP